MADAGIIRSNGKIDAAISGARIYLDMRERGEDFGRCCGTWSAARRSRAIGGRRRPDPDAPGRRHGQGA
jgi:3-methyladenine DNA glycosylase Tag